jgi:hypothetical protein
MSSNIAMQDRKELKHAPGVTQAAVLRDPAIAQGIGQWGAMLRGSLVTSTVTDATTSR